MSSYRSRCGEIRQRILDGERQAEIASESDMPSDSTLGKHVLGKCICEPAIPPLEGVGSGPTRRYRVAEAADCPDCDHADGVETLDGFAPTWYCHGCDQRFGLKEISRTPIVATEGRR